MVEQFHQYRFTPIRVLSQLRKRRIHPIIGSISFFVVTAIRTTAMLGGFSNVTVFRVRHSSLHNSN